MCAPLIHDFKKKKKCDKKNAKVCCAKQTYIENDDRRPNLLCLNWKVTHMKWYKTCSKRVTTTFYVIFDRRNQKKYIQNENKKEKKKNRYCEATEIVCPETKGTKETFFSRSERNGQARALTFEQNKHHTVTERGSSDIWLSCLKRKRKELCRFGMWDLGH